MDIQPPYKTVLLLQDLEFGGTQRYAVNTLGRLDPEMFAAELWVLRGGMDMAEAALATDRPVTWLTKAPAVGPQAILRLFLKLRKERPHILYTLTGVPNIWGRPFGKLLGTRVIASSWRGLVQKQYESVLWRFSDRIICNAAALKRHIITEYSIDPPRIAVIPNAVDTSFFCPNGEPKAPDPTILFIGRYVTEKDPLTLLEACRLVKSRVPNAKLIMVANGSLEPQVREFIARHSLADVTLLPGRPDNRDLLSKAWVFALSSIREGSPNVILEAMSAGVPIAATRVGGIPELVQDGHTGLLTEPANPRALADALLHLLENDDLRLRMGEEARRHVLGAHSLDATAKMTGDALLSAMAASKK